MDMATSFLLTVFPVSLDLVMLLYIVSFATSLITVAFGIGGGLLMLVVLVMILPVEVVVPVHAMIQLSSTLGRVWVYRPHIQTDVVKSFLPGCLLGTILATIYMVNFAGWVVEFLILLYILWTLAIDSLRDMPGRKSNFTAIGIGTSFLSSFIGATGPLVAPFLYRENMRKKEQTGTFAACMSVQHLIKLIAFSLTGFYFIEWLPLVVLLSLSGFMGTIVGRMTQTNLAERMFRRVYKISKYVMRNKLLLHRRGRLQLIQLLQTKSLFSFK